MTREQAKKKLIDLGIAEPTEEQVTNLLDSVTNEIKTEKTRAEKYKTEAEKAEDLQRQLDDIGQKNLSDLEKEQKARAAAEQKAAELQTQLTRSAVETVFAGAQLTGDQYKGMIDALSNLDVEVARSSAEAFTKGIADRDAANKAQWDKEKLDKTPNPGNKTPPADPGAEESLAAKYAKEYSANANPQQAAVPPTPSPTY